MQLQLAWVWVVQPAHKVVQLANRSVAVDHCCRRLEKALQNYMKDFVERMKEIKDVLSSGSAPTATAAADTPGATDAAGSSDKVATLAEQEALCDELMDIVESVDYARGEHLQR